MRLYLSDDETAALRRELDIIVDADHFPLSPRILTLRGDPRQAQTRAGARAHADDEAIRAADKG
jgi:hypothetical protein